MATSSEKGQRLIFVGGAPRSGTTLVQNILDSHPDICGSPEFLHIRDIVDLRNKLHNSIGLGYIDRICSPDEVDGFISSLIEKLLLPLADSNGYKFLSEKTPENVLVFSEMINLFPEARFIHVVRDPRAVIASLLEVKVRAKNKGIKPPRYTANTRAAIKHTKKCLTNGFLASKVAPKKVLTVIYERLVTEPEDEIMRICEFLEIEWSRNMVNPGKFEHLGEQAITVQSNEVWYSTQTYNRDPDTQSLDTWKTSLTPTQKAIVAMSFKDCADLTQLEYNFSIDGISIINRFFGIIHQALTYLIDQGLYRIVQIKAR